MNANPLIQKTSVKTALLAFVLAGLTGCASLPDAQTSTQPAECKIAPLNPTQISDRNRKPVDKLDQAKAVADFARYEASMRNLSPRHQLQFEEMLRDCNR